MIFIGDVHGKFEQFFQITNHFKNEDICQIGDFGVGFPNHPYPLKMEERIKWIRGNHDDPNISRNHPNYLGDYGYIESNGIFYLSGAWSIDWQHRIKGLTIWDDEELSYSELSKAMALYVEKKPKILISHDCPDEVAFQILKGRHQIKTRTSQALQAMFEQHIPSVHCFGHWHESFEANIKGCEFRCLAELEILEIPTLKW